MRFDASELNWLAIAVACLATFFLGGAWYTILGPAWVKYSRFTPEQLAEMKTTRPPPVFFGGMVVSYFIFAFFLAVLLRNLAVSTLPAALAAGGIIWMAIAVPIGLTSWLASSRHFMSCVIDLTFQLIFIVGCTVLLALWR